MPIEWDVELPDRYTLCANDIDRLPEKRLESFIREALLKNKLRYYNEDGSSKESPILDNGTILYWKTNLDIDIDTRLAINIKTFSFCCHSNYQIPLQDVNYPIKTKYDFLIFLFELGNSFAGNKIEILKFTPELKRILLCNSEFDFDNFIEDSFFGFLKKHCQEFTFQMIAGANPLDEDTKYEIWKLAGELSESICEKEILEYLNTGFSIELKDIDLKLLNPPIKELEYDWEGQTKKITIEQNPSTKRFTKVVPIPESSHQTVPLNTIIDKVFHLDRIAVGINQNSIIKIVYDKDNKVQLLSPPKEVSYELRLKKEKKQNIMGFFHTVFGNTVIDLLDDLYSRKISSDDGERTYDYFNPKDLSRLSTKYTIASIKCRQVGKTKIIGRKFQPFNIRKPEEVKITIESIIKAFKKAGIEIEYKTIEADIHKLIENPPSKKKRRLKPGKAQTYHVIEKNQTAREPNGVPIPKDEKFRAEDWYDDFRDTYNIFLDEGMRENDIKKEIIRSFDISEEQFNILHTMYIEETAFIRENIPENDNDIDFE